MFGIFVIKLFIGKMDHTLWSIICNWIEALGNTLKKKTATFYNHINIW